MKETEEELYKRVQEQVIESYVDISLEELAKRNKEVEICKAYHQERMKSILPSEQEIVLLLNKHAEETVNYHNGDADTPSNSLYYARKIIELLTKGDR